MLSRLTAAGLTNAGSVALTQAVLTMKREGPESQREAQLEWALARFENALASNTDYAVARWGLARAALLLDKISTGTDEQITAAAEILRPLVASGTHNPLLYGDALTVFSRGGRPEDVIMLYELNPTMARTQTLSDTVALAYLQRGLPGDLARARILRPGDLYLNYHLWRAAREAGDTHAADNLGNAIMHFPLEAVNPSDDRLLDYAARAIPPLLAEGFWDRNKLLNVMSFLVWQHNGSVSVERLLDQLVESYPTEPDWPFYLAELYHRRGDLDRAMAGYQQVLVLDPAYAWAYLRSGMLAEIGTQEQLREAAKWYGQYHDMAPDDLLGLQRLTEVCTTLEEVDDENEYCREAAERVIRSSKSALRGSSAAVLRESLEAKTDDRRIVADLLDVPVENVELGPDLVLNGGFEDPVYGRPEPWVWTNMATGDPWSEGVFAGYAEPLAAWQGRSVRIDGFWMREEKNLEEARGGFWYRTQEAENQYGVPLRPDGRFLLSFYYRTDRMVENDVALWVSNDPDILFKGGYRFPPTSGGWRRAVIIGWNNSKEQGFIRPVMLDFGTGSVWFDEMVLREINLASNILPDDRTTRLWMLDGLDED